MLTAQSLPKGLVEFCDRYPTTWAELRLQGLPEDEQLPFFSQRGLDASPSQPSIFPAILSRIAQIYEGHPLVLKAIAEDIQNRFAGDVGRYWQQEQTEFEQVARELQGDRLDEMDYNEVLERRVRDRIRQSLAPLPEDALALLRRSAVFRRPVPKKFWLSLLADRSAPEKKAAYRQLCDRALVEPEGPHIRQHTLIRAIAYDWLRADAATWEATERQAAHLWLKAYQPAPDAPNLETVRGYLEAFDHYCAVGDWQTAADLPNTKLETGNELYWQLYIWSYFEELIPLHSQLLAIARERCDRAGEGAALGHLGIAYSSLGQHERAIDYHLKCLAIMREIGHRQGESAALGNLGNAYDSLGQYERAIEHHQQDLKIAREIGDRQGEGTALGNLGNAYDRLGQYERAIEHYQQNLKIAREIGDRQGEITALGNLGDTQIRLQQYAEALENSHSALDIAREIGTQFIEAAILCTVGEIHLKLEQYSEAPENFHAALEIFREIGAQANEGEVLKHLAELHQALGDRSAAQHYCQQALTLATELGIPLQKDCEALQFKIQNS